MYLEDYIGGTGCNQTYTEDYSGGSDHNQTYTEDCIGGTDPNQTCTEDYIGETDCRIKERIFDYNKRDKNSHILKYSLEERHTHIWDKDFKGFGINYRSAFRRKISEPLFIETLKPSLNVKKKKKKSVRLHHTIDF